MSTEIPDTRSFQSREDVFHQYPIPVVRGIEKKLRREVDDNQEKLRSLVGASYRDLLGTARSIVDIHTQIQSVETSLGDIGRRSDSRVLDKVAINFAKIERTQKDEGKKRLETSARLAVLHRCLNKISQVLADGGSTLLCAKLLVVSRLLHRTLSGESRQPILKTLGFRLSCSRQRLLRHIDKRFARVNITNASLVEDMTAFALATSSTPSDVLKHLHFIRSNMLSRTWHRRNIHESILARISLFLHTLRDTKACFPEILAASLKLLGTKPLLEDSTILELDDLGLDMHLQWLPDDLVNYTPYTRHDELDRSKTTQLLRDWGVRTCKVLGAAVNLDIKDTQDLPTVLNARRAALQLWLTSRRVTSGLPWTQVLDNLRAPFDRQARSIIQNSATTLQTSVCGIITLTIHDWSKEAAFITQKDLWTRSLVSMDVSTGAIEFQKAISSSLTGKHNAIELLVRVLDWNRQKVQDTQAVLKEMKDTRWEYDDIDDEDDDSDDDSSSSISKLSKVDPQELQQVLRQSTVEAVNKIDEVLSLQVDAACCDFEDFKSTGPFVLRSLRELRYHIPRLLQTVDKAVPIEFLCDKLVNALHRSLAESLVRKKKPSFSAAIRNLINSRYNIPTLWTGAPPLPVQPSAGIFKLLRATVKDMEAIGTDMWSVDALTQLKVAQQAAVSKVIEEQLDQVQSLLSSNQPLQPMPLQRLHEKDEGANAQELHNGTVDVADDSQHADEQSIGSQPKPTPSILTVLGIPSGNNEATKSQSVSNGTVNTEPEAGDNTPLAKSSDAERPSSSSTAPQTQTTVNVARLPSQLESKFIQMYFDGLYLDSAFSLASNEHSDQSPLFSVAQKVKQLAKIDEAAEARIVKSASEYWRRTYLLFGLLASG